LGSRVTLVTKSERLLPDFDLDISAAAQRGAKATGITVRLSEDPAPHAGGAERVIVSTARRPNLEQLQLGAAGIAPSTTQLVVDDHLRIDRHVFAIGDGAGDRDGCNRRGHRAHGSRASDICRIVDGGGRSRGRPPGSYSPPEAMITRVFFGARRSDLTTEACLAHWRGTHAAIGARLPGVRAYVQNHGVLSDGRFLLPYPCFDFMSELDWDDLGAMYV